MKVVCTFIVLLGLVTGAAAGTIESVAGDGDPKNVGQPFGVEFGPDSRLYICDVQNHVIHQWDPRTKKTVIVAGDRTKGYSGDGGAATAAAMNEPYEIRFDSAGNLYVVEMRNAIVRRIDGKTGVITTIAGTGEVGFSGDGGPATKAQFRQPHSIALDEAKAHLYIADIGNHRIRRVDLRTGIVETFAGNGEKKLPTEGKVGPDKPMIGPRALFIDGRTMWIALREGHSIYKVDLDSGMLEHVAGTGKKGYSGDAPGGGSAKTAQFDGPKGIAARDGKVYIVDTENQAIRMIDTATGTITTIAGDPALGKEARGYGGDGGPASRAKMDRPHGICIGPDGAVYIGDTNNHRVRRVVP